MENTVFERNYEIVEKDDRATAVFERAFAPGGFMEEFTKKMDAIPKVVVPKDKENYDYLLNRCDDYAKRHHGRIRGVVDYEHWDAAGSRNNFRLAGAYMMGASELHVNVGRANSWSNYANSAATQFTLGYNYNLSKRTKVYGYYTKVNNSANADYMTGANGVDFSSVAVGVRHNF